MTHIEKKAQELRDVVDTEGVEISVRRKNEIPDAYIMVDFPEDPFKPMILTPDEADSILMLVN